MSIHNSFDPFEPSPEHDFDAYVEFVHGDAMTNQYGDLNAIVALGPSSPDRRRLDRENDFFDDAPIHLDQYTLDRDDFNFHATRLPRTNRHWMMAFAAFLGSIRGDEVDEDGDPRELENDPRFAADWLHWLRVEPMRESVWMLWRHLSDPPKEQPDIEICTD